MLTQATRSLINLLAISAVIFGLALQSAPSYSKGGSSFLQKLFETAASYWKKQRYFPSHLERYKIISKYEDKLDNKHLDAVRIELSGGSVGINPKTGKSWDHITEVREAMGGVKGTMEAIMRQLGSPSSRLTQAERDLLQAEYSDAAKLLDYVTKTTGLRAP